MAGSTVHTHTQPLVSSCTARSQTHTYTHGSVSGRVHCGHLSPDSVTVFGPVGGLLECACDSGERLELLALGVGLGAGHLASLHLLLHGGVIVLRVVRVLADQARLRLRVRPVRARLLHGACVCVCVCVCVCACVCMRVVLARHPRVLSARRWLLLDVRTSPSSCHWSLAAPLVTVTAPSPPSLTSRVWRRRRAVCLAHCARTARCQRPTYGPHWPVGRPGPTLAPRAARRPAADVDEPIADTDGWRRLDGCRRRRQTGGAGTSSTPGRCVAAPAARRVGGTVRPAGRIPVKVHNEKSEGSLNCSISRQNIQDDGTGNSTRRLVLATFLG